MRAFKIKSKTSRIVTLCLACVATFSIYTALAQKIAVIPLDEDLIVVPIFNSETEVDPQQTIIVVAKSGGDFSDPIAAMNSITNSSKESPYTILIKPGRYDLSETLVLKDYVNIVGEGPSSSLLNSLIIQDDLITYDEKIHKTSIIAGDITSIRNIRIHVGQRYLFGESFLNVAILNQGTSLRIRNAEISISGESPVAIRNINATLDLAGSTVGAATINVSAPAITAMQSSLNIHDSAISGSAPYGTPAIIGSRDGSPTVISNSKITGGGARESISIYGKNILFLASIITNKGIEVEQSNSCFDSVGSDGIPLLENCQPST